MATFGFGDDKRTPLENELANRKERVEYLRAQLAETQEKLRIEIALLATVKLLAKGDK